MLAQRCLIAIQRQDWPRAEALATQALTVVHDGHLDAYDGQPAGVRGGGPGQALRRGDAGGAAAWPGRLACGHCTHSLPTYAVEALPSWPFLLALNDAAGARAILGQARGVVSPATDLGNLPAQVERRRRWRWPERSPGRRR